MIYLRLKVSIIEKYKKLLSDSAIFAIGNFGSKLISFIMVPLYSIYLTRSEYGTIDLVITFVNVLLPLISLSIFESTLRFTLDEKQDKKTVFSVSVIFTFLSCLATIVFTVFLNFFMQVNNYLLFMVVIVCLQSIQTLLSQFVRAVNRLKLYAINGLVLTILMGISNIVLLVIFNLKIDGYFLSIIFSNILSIFLLYFFGNLHSYFDMKLGLNKKILKKMLKYSIPIIPNALMWWVMNAVSRTLILKHSGIEENGLYAMANKIPSLIAMLSTIFFQAWQLLAIEQEKNKDSPETYSIVFNYFSKFLFLGTSFLILVNKPLIELIISNQFYESWKYVPLLLLASLFSAFSNFFAIFYNVSMETKGIFTTSFIGGAISVLMNLALIPMIGVYGAALSTICSFLVVCGIRQRYSKKQFGVVYNNVSVFISVSLLLFQCIVSFLELRYEFIYQIIMFILLMYFNKDILKIFLKIFKLRRKV